MTLLLQIAVILGLSRVVSRVFVVLKQPAVIGEMFAGLLLGPSCFGAAFPAAFAAVFPAASLPSLNALSQIGLVLFMFIVGLRLKSHSIDMNRRAAIVTSATSIVVPLALGTAAGLALHARLAPAG